MRYRFLLLAVVAMVACGVATAQEDAKYAGVDNCMMCHRDTFDEWSKTAHAKSFELLANVGQEENAECLGCHTTGYGKDGYVDEATTPNLRGVTCEACHGPGLNHKESADKSKIQGAPAASTCAACHKGRSIHSLSE